MHMISLPKMAFPDYRYMCKYVPFKLLEYNISVYCKGSVYGLLRPMFIYFNSKLININVI